MIDWNVFYKAIGIAENIIDPSYYHILDLEVQDCDSQKVTQALLDKKRRLRQSIPSPEFIAPMLLFEKEVLEKAAEVLGDDAQRVGYNEQLMGRQRGIESKNRKKQKLIVDVRDAIAEAVDEKGMLGGVERYLLEEKLRLLEVQEHNIKQILARIPEPLNMPVFDQQRLLMFFAGAVQLSITNDTLGLQEEKNLMQLAERLGLDDMQSRLIVDQQLAQLSASREGAVIRKNAGVDGIVLEKPIRMEEPAAAQGQEPVIKKTKPVKTETLPPEDIEEAVEQMHRVTTEKVSQVVVPILAIAVFIMTVVFLNAMNQKRTAPPDVQSLLPVVKPLNETDKPAVQKEAAGPVVEKPQPQVSKTAIREAAKPVVAQVARLVSDLNTYQLSKADASADMILADSAMLMMAVCERAFNYEQVPGRFGRDLKGMSSNVQKRVGKVQALVDELGIEVEIDDIQGEILMLRLGELKRILHSDIEEDRLYAIGRLAAIGHPQAYEVVLEALEDRTILDKSHAVMNGLLNICARSQDMSVAGKLAEMMERTGRQTAFQIQLTLMNMTGLMPSGAGVLPLKNTLQQRKDASVWWQNQVWNWQGTAGEDTPDTQSYSFERTLTLSATFAYLARQAADTLSSENFADDETYRQRLRLKYGFGHPDIDQLEHSPAAASDFLADVTGRLVRQSAPDAFNTDAAVLNRKVRLLACDDDIQVATVNLSAVIDYLEILAQATDAKGQYQQLLSTLREDCQTQMKNSETDLLKLRTACYHTVRHWDLVLQIKEHGGQ